MARKNRKIVRKEPKKRVSAEAVTTHHRDLMGIVFLMAAAVVLLSLASYSPDDPVLRSFENASENTIGLVGAYLADALIASVGLMAFLLVPALGVGALAAFGLISLKTSFRKLAWGTLLGFQGAALAHMVSGGKPVLGHSAGGVVGEAFAGLLIFCMARTGAYLLLVTGVMACSVSLGGFSPSAVFRRACDGSWRFLRWSGKLLASLGGRGARSLVRAVSAASRFLSTEAAAFWTSLRQQPAEVISAEPALAVAAAGSSPPRPSPPRAGRQESFFDGPDEFHLPPDSLPPEPLVVTGENGDTVRDRESEDWKAGAPVRKKAKKREQLQQKTEPEIVIPKVEKASADGADSSDKARSGPDGSRGHDYSNFQLPSVEFLEQPPHDQHEMEIEKEKLQEYARLLEEKLSNYGVEGRVSKIMPGPVVTMYEYVPAPGVKVSKIAGLSNDLALALGAMSVRIIAPIPGRSVVGIEVANKERQTVYAREIIGHQVFRRSRSKLTLALGKNIEGAPFVADLNQMPHLLVAGATGTGKSVALNAMITSILYRATPEEVRFIMVDPKVLELSLYEGIPHLLLPVVTDPRKAQAALNWAVGEMERRIKILHAAGVRNLDAYNRKVAKLNGEDAEQRPAKKRKVIVIDKTGATDGRDASSGSTAGGEKNIEENEKRFEKLPHIVIVIDELADLMMQCGRDVETAIARIAQKARAAGIHLIVATQRPSVNVITGLIKANLPARISFRVASKTDSRTILDANGAETLLGKGDMLFHPPTSSELVRVHGALITEDEINRV
ncbi:MAG: DNA translocase FtsK, partial [Deltaproteobacteria bacterium]